MKNLSKLCILVLALPMPSFAARIELGEIKGFTFTGGGYFKAENIWSFAEVENNYSQISIRQTRFNLKAAKKNTSRKFEAFIEYDYWGIDNEDNPRLRHAYLTLGNLTIGETWSGNFYATAPFDVRMINFRGPGFGSIGGSGLTVRPDFVVHYRTQLRSLNRTQDQTIGVIISAAKPLYDNASFPDTVLSFQKRYKSGSGYSLSVAAREAQNVVKNDSAFGATLSFQGKLAFDKGALTAGAYAGRGQAPNTGLCGNGGTFAPDFAPAPDSVKIAGCDFDAMGDMVSQAGFSFGVTRRLTEKLRGTMRYGKVVVNNTANSSAYMTTATLLYSHTKHLDFGIEWRDQNMKNHPFRPIGQQVEVMFMYKF